MKFSAVISAMVVSAAAAVASANTISFKSLMTDGTTSGTAGQYTATVTGVTTQFAGVTRDGVKFTFTNTAAPGANFVGSSVAQIYFDDGNPAMLDIFGHFENKGTAKKPNLVFAYDSPIIESSTGVTFVHGASPGDVPGQSFTADYASGSKKPAPVNGLNGVDDWVSFTFALATDSSTGTSFTFDDVLASLATGGLRLGLHVISIDNYNDGSEWFVSEPITVPGGGGGGNPPAPVPLPPAALGGLALLGIIGVNRLRQSRKAR